MSSNVVSEDIRALISLKLHLKTSDTPLLKYWSDKKNFERILEADQAELFHYGFEPALIKSAASFDRADTEIKRFSDMGGCFLPITSEKYPSMLREIADPPVLLCVLGNANVLNELSIAVIGARKAGNDGVKFAFNLGRELAKCGVTVVSGFAFGVDINAHMGAAENGATVAVLGSGFNKIYPQEHKRYLEKILKKGAVISDFPLDEPANPYNFPRRNRIISGLCKGVVVVEASKKSGSLITARLALEQGRDVFAVPANPTSFNNATNYLIKNGAILVESYLDVIKEYKSDFKDLLTEPESLYIPPAEYKDVWDCLLIEPMNVDELLNKSGLTYDKIFTSVTFFELEKKLIRGADGRYNIVK
jgi:DNA processing protein